MGVSTGDALRIQASDWNRVLQMLRDWQAPGGTSSEVGQLPCVKATLRAKFGERRPSLYEVVDLYGDGRVKPNASIEATLPLGDEWKPSQLEREHIFRDDNRNTGAQRLEYKLMRPRTFTDIDFNDLHRTFAVCLNPTTLEFAVSGFAFARVRFHSQWHTYARHPMLVPGDSNVAGNENPDVVKYTGCLDSSGSGPARIVVILNNTTFVPWDEMRGKAFWAIVQW